MSPGEAQAENRCLFYMCLTDIFSWGKGLNLSSFLGIHDPIRSSGVGKEEMREGHRWGPKLQVIGAPHPYLETAHWTSPPDDPTGASNNVTKTEINPPNRFGFLFSFTCAWHCCSPCFPSQSLEGECSLLICPHISHPTNHQFPLSVPAFFPSFSTCSVQTLT